MVFKKRGKGHIGPNSYRHFYKKIKWTIADYRRYWERRFIEIDRSVPAHDIPTVTAISPSNTSGPKKKWKRSQEEWRWVIAFFYEEILLSPPREEWKHKGKYGGTITEIIKLLNMKKGSRSVIEKVLIECEEAEKRGDSPNFERQKRRFGPRIKKLESGSIYEYLAADYLERGCSPALTAYFVNIHLNDDNKDFTISEQCVIRLKKSLDPVITKIRKNPQSRQQHKDWAHARHNWVLHLLTRLGMLKPTPEDFRDNVIPKWCDIKLLEESNYTFNIHQVVFFNEVHKKAINGMSAIAHNRDQVRFIRDKLTHRITANEDIMSSDEFPPSIEDATDSDKLYIGHEATQATAKFPKEARMCAYVYLLYKS